MANDVALRAGPLPANPNLQRHQNTVAIDAMALPVAPAPAFALEAEPLAEGARRRVVVENRERDALEPSLPRPVERLGEQALAAMACDQAHAEAADMGANRGGVRGTIAPADHVALDRHDLRSTGLAQAGHKGPVALDRWRSAARASAPRGQRHQDSDVSRRDRSLRHRDVRRGPPRAGANRTRHSGRIALHWRQRARPCFSVTLVPASALPSGGEYPATATRISFRMSGRRRTEPPGAATQAPSPELQWRRALRGTGSARCKPGW